MSTQNSAPNHDHAHGLINGVIFAAILAILGYVFGYLLLLLAGQNLIVVTVANITRSALVHNIVVSQYAGATILPYLLALFLGVVGLAYGYVRYR